MPIIVHLDGLCGSGRPRPRFTLVLLPASCVLRPASCFLHSCLLYFSLLPFPVFLQTCAMPVFAAVDIGANSVRLKIARLVRRRLKTLEEDREVTRLGDAVFHSGMLAPQALRLLRLWALWGKLPRVSSRQLAPGPG